jgi:hypothetical protein
MKETVIFLQDLFYANTFERYQVIRKGLTYHTVNGWEARRPESWDAGSSNRF